MKRDVLLVYLRDLRDLEVASYQLETTNKKEKQQLNHEVQKLNSEISNIQTEKYVSEPKKSIGGWIWFYVILIISIVETWALLEVIYLAITDDHDLWIYVVFMVFAVGFSWLLTFGASPDWKEKRAAKKHNQEEQRRLSTDAPKQVQERKALIQQKTAARNARDKSLFDEYCKVRRLLNSAYSINIIPNQYRNLASIYYIYDYMSTSQATLEETLMHEHMENGIQRILAKLDTIIAQNEEIILNTRCIEANTRETANNTKRMLANEQRMLESMARTEQNTAEAAQAAQISATYSEVNAYFSAATYFSKRR